MNLVKIPWKINSNEFTTMLNYLYENKIKIITDNVYYLIAEFDNAEDEIMFRLKFNI